MNSLSRWNRTASVLLCLGLSAKVFAADAQQRVANLVPFDLANCAPRTLELSKPLNEFSVQAAFRAARPYLQECLADGSGFDATKGVRGKVTVTVDSSGAKVVASGDGLQAGPKACIEKVVTERLGTVAPLAAEAKPITFDGPFERGANTAVRMGINEASDIQGSVRLALPQWCSCFEDYKEKVAPGVAGQVTLTRADMLGHPDRFKLPDGQIPKQLLPVASALTGTYGDAAAGKVATCLNAKIAALPLKSKSEQFISPVQVLLLNSNATDSMPSTALPQLQFAQLDAVREQRQAEAFASLGRRQKTADDYDRAVLRYQTGIKSPDAKKRKAASGMLNELKSGCAALVKADEAYSASLQTQAAVEQKAVDLARSLKASDASWADAEAAANGAAGDTQKQIANAKELKAANEKACPKTKF